MQQPVVHLALSFGDMAHNVEWYMATEALLANPLHIGSFLFDSDMVYD